MKSKDISFLWNFLNSKTQIFFFITVSFYCWENKWMKRDRWREGKGLYKINRKIIKGYESYNQFCSILSLELSAHQNRGEKGNNGGKKWISTISKKVDSIARVYLKARTTSTFQRKSENVQKAGKFWFARKKRLVVISTREIKTDGRPLWFVPRRMLPGFRKKKKNGEFSRPALRRRKELWEKLGR